MKKKKSSKPSVKTKTIEKFHSVGFELDKTERLVENLIQKETVHTEGGI